jgi:hypothetical protein
MVLTETDFLADGLNLFIGAVDVTNAFDAAATLEFNCINFSIITSPGSFLAVNGFPDEDALVTSGLCNMDSDSIGLSEELEQIIDSLSISTLENNLFNFGVDPGNPMDESTLPLIEDLDINEAVGTPPGSGLPPFSAGALIYSTP